MRRMPFSLLPILLFVGLLLPTPWSEIRQARAVSAVPHFKGVVTKCVGFNLRFSSTEHALVYVHNDGPNALVTRVRFLDGSGNTHSNAVGTILPGHTIAFNDSGTDDDILRVMVAKVTSSEPTAIVDAERVAATGTDLSTLERRHITCVESDEAPDFLPG
jgi:hypothetical protein